MAEKMVSEGQQADTITNATKIEESNLDNSEKVAEKEEDTKKATSVADIVDEKSGSKKKATSSESVTKKKTTGKTKTTTKKAKAKQTKSVAKSKQKESNKGQAKLYNEAMSKKDSLTLDGDTKNKESAEPEEIVAMQNSLENNNAKSDNSGAGNVATEKREEKAPAFVKKAKPKHNYTKAQIITVSALGYLLIFLPFIFCREEPFARYHLNQALVLWIFAVPLYLIFAFIPNVNIIAIPIICMFHILGIMIGFAYAVRGRAKHLPLIGRITIIKWER